MKQTLQMTTKQSLRQNFGMSQKMQQAIRLLQLSAAELDIVIQDMLETNPMLEIAEYKKWEGLDQIENNCQETTLHDYLYWQLNLTNFNEREKMIAYAIIDSINEDGYLSHTLEEILPGLTNIEILPVLKRVQQFDPIGIAARDLSECMLLQIKPEITNEDLYAKCVFLINEHLNLLACKDYVKIKQLINLDDSELKIVLESIAKINPKPGSIINNIKTNYIIPDLIAEFKCNQLHVSLNQDINYKLKINNKFNDYTGLDKHDAEFLQTQLSDARWFLYNIETRNSNLLKTATYIVEHQTDFFKYGEEALLPLTLSDVANVINLNISTVSRLINNKYIHTPRGIFALKFFFSSNIYNKKGANKAAAAIKAVIRRMISEEVQPLSDQDITNLFAQQGIKLARRTVTKYRESLGIQPSTQRGV